MRNDFDQMENVVKRSDGALCCGACEETWYQCVCQAVDRFFENASGLKIAPVYSLDAYRRTREIKRL